MRNSIYTQGRKDGRGEGRGEGRAATLLHQVQRRIGRDPSTLEVAVVVRLAATEEGAERLGDAVLDLRGDDLARWLASHGG